MHLARCSSFAFAGGLKDETEAKPNPNPAKSGPRSAKLSQVSARKILGFPSPNRALSMTYDDPLGIFFFVHRFRRKGGHGAAAPLLVRSCLRFLFVFISGSSGLMKQVKGWRRFRNRGRVGALSARPDGRVASSRKEGTLAFPDPLGHDPWGREAIKTGRSIRCPARIRPLEKPDPARAFG
jgi:hypothetical protein